jgi:uncharacterized protein YjbI with pentapeptide repeats
MNGVKFIHCKFTAQAKATFRSLKNSNIEFEYTTFEAEEMGPPKITFAGSTAALTFRNSTVTGVQLVDLVLPSSLTFENSKLQDIDMSRSKLAKLVMDGVKGGGATGFDTGNVAEVVFRNSEVGINLGEMTLGKVSYVNSVVNVNFASSNIKELQINNCKGMEDLNLYQAKIDSLQIGNCPVSDLAPIEATIQNFSINKASIENSKFKKMKVVNFTLTDVSLDGHLDFSNAHVEHLITKNITQKSGLNLNLTGSNVKF